jgi:hypothetical protein
LKSTYRISLEEKTNHRAPDPDATITFFLVKTAPTYEKKCGTDGEKEAR